MEYYLSILKGNYYVYAHWFDPRKTPSEIIIKALINIYSYDPFINALRVRMLSKAFDQIIQQEVEWDYEGIIICYDQKMVFLLEDFTKRTELVWILANIPESTDFDYIHGILCAGLWRSGVIVSLPAASRILFKKIQENLSLEELRLNVSRKLSLDDIKEEDDQIPAYIANKISPGMNILTIPLPPVFVETKTSPKLRNRSKSGKEY
jgi:hypothetical protein